MIKGRKKDHIWQFVKFNVDNAIYAMCSCGFRYACYKNIGKGFKAEPDPERLYNYCPICGIRKTRYIEEVKKIDKFPWDEYI